MKRIKIFLARVFLPILTVWLCVMPSRSYALAPALIPLAGVFLEADAAAAGVAASIAIAEAATGTSVGAASASVSSAVGAGLLALAGAAVTYMAVNDADGKAVRIPLVADPVKGLIPAPLAAPPSVIPAHYVYSYDYWVTSHDTFCGVVSALYAYRNTLWTNPQESITSCNEVLRTAQIWVAGDGYNYAREETISTFQYQMAAASCPAGSHLNVDVCVIDQPRQTQPDNKLDFQRSGNTYAAPLSVDADAAQTLQGSLSPSGSVQIVGQDAQGRTVYYDISPRTDGGSIVKKQTQVSTITGDTGVQTVTIQVAPSGVVESASQATTAGQVSVSAGTTAGNASATSTTSSTSLDTQPQITFPNDYARQGEAVAAANTLAPKLDTMRDALTQTTTVPDPIEPLPADMPGFGNTFSSLLSWQLPGHSSACPSLTFDLSMMSPGWSNMVMNSHCTLLQGKTQEFAVAMMLVWSLLAMMIVLRA